MSIEIESIFEKRINALEGAAHAEWPGDRRALQPEHFLDFVEQFQRRPAFAVELVDESDDRRVAQPANFHQLDRARFDTLGRSEEHTSELQSLMRISYAVFCLKNNKQSS